MTQHVLSLSYGKDSLACLGTIEKLGWPLDRIVHIEVMATDTIPADLPPMVEFKAKADAIIKERYGLEVEHICATRGGARDFYERRLYDRFTTGKHVGTLRGFPLTKGAWCRHLKTDGEANIPRYILSSPKEAGAREDLWLSDAQGELVQCVEDKTFSQSSLAQGADINVVQYLGIAADEPERIKRHTKPGFALPLVDIGWDEAYCRKWCEENDLLSPIYSTATRGGCWFCHNQGIGQLRLLRKNYPDLWALLMKWDLDSPVSFKPDGHTVHDFDKRFQIEEEGKIPTDRTFRWKMLEESNV